MLILDKCGWNACKLMLILDKCGWNACKLMLMTEVSLLADKWLPTTKQSDYNSLDRYVWTRVVCDNRVVVYSNNNFHQVGCYWEGNAWESQRDD